MRIRYLCLRHIWQGVYCLVAVSHTLGCKVTFANLIFQETQPGHSFKITCLWIICSSSSFDQCVFCILLNDFHKFEIFCMQLPLAISFSLFPISSRCHVSVKCNMSQMNMCYLPYLMGVKKWYMCYSVEIVNYPKVVGALLGLRAAATIVG